MERLGKNKGGYHGETIDIRTVLRAVEIAAQQHGWSFGIFRQTPEFKFLALRRPLLSIRNPQSPIRIYLSAGIHGDEPAGPLAALRLLRENNWPADSEIWRKRGVTDKRVSNAKLRAELKYGFQFPDFRAGYAALCVEALKE